MLADVSGPGWRRNPPNFEEQEGNWLFYGDPFDEDLKENYVKIHLVKFLVIANGKIAITGGQFWDNIKANKGLWRKFISPAICSEDEEYIKSLLVEDE